MTRRGEPTTGRVWPRAYLLQLYNEAIAQGYIWVQPISRTEATGLRMSFYNLRRRSTTSNASIITPEMHLVTVGSWQAGATDPDMGRLPFLYSKLPDDIPLPDIIGASGEEIAQLREMEMPEPPAPVPFDIPEAELTLAPADVTSFVERMKASAAAKTAADD